MTNCFGSSRHALLQPVGALTIPDGMRDEVRPHLAADYSSQMLAFLRARLMTDPSDGFDEVQYLEKHILTFECSLGELCGPETLGLERAKRNRFANNSS